MQGQSSIHNFTLLAGSFAGHCVNIVSMLVFNRDYILIQYISGKYCGSSIFNTKVVNESIISIHCNIGITFSELNEGVRRQPYNKPICPILFSPVFLRLK